LLHQQGTAFPAILPFLVKNPALWANEVHSRILLCGRRFLHREKELPAFSAEFFQGVVFDVTLRANDHLSLLKPLIPVPLGGVIMHFMCHRMNNFSPQISMCFRESLKKGIEQNSRIWTKIAHLAAPPAGNISKTGTNALIQKVSVHKVRSSAPGGVGFWTSGEI
jgi:hypothetical protein